MTIKERLRIKGLGLSHSFYNHIGYYLCFNVVFLIITVINLSLISFFHFLLNHQLGDIQDWIFFHGWEILIIGKLISFVVLTKFINILSPDRKPFERLLEKRKGDLSMALFVNVAFFLLGIIIIGVPSKNPLHSWDLIRQLLIMIGFIVLFGCEVFFCLTLDEIFPLLKKERVILNIVFSFIFFFHHKVLINFALSWDLALFFWMIYILNMTFLTAQQKSWLRPLVVIMTLIVPLGIFFGQDPINGSTYTPYILKNPISAIEVGCFVLLSQIYWSLKVRK